MRRLILLPVISQRIGELLSRNGIVRLLTALHDELPGLYSRYRNLRHPDDDRLCLFFSTLGDGSQMHRFTFFVDDTTSPDHLIIEQFEHDARTL